MPFCRSAVLKACCSVGLLSPAVMHKYYIATCDIMTLEVSKLLKLVVLFSDAIQFVRLISC